jgi:hypothetical protein
MADDGHFRGVRKNPMKVPTCGALITICDNKWYLGTWRNLEKATRSYDWVAIQHLGEQAQCNFPTD